MNTTTLKPRINLSQAALWASVFVIASLVVIQSQKLLGDPARADVVSSVGGMTAMTVESNSEDLLTIIDGRSETLFVYRINNKTSLDLLRSYNLPAIFSDQRTRAGGGGRQR